VLPANVFFASSAGARETAVAAIGKNTRTAYRERWRMNPPPNLQLTMHKMRFFMQRGDAGLGLEPATGLAWRLFFSSILVNFG
jgi:hypothetical protein